jgi:hypothetical protein
MIAIKHRHTNTTLCEFDVSNIRIAVESAVTNCADLRGAYLDGACLRGANLCDAYLDGADLRGACLRGADLRGACLRGADLRGAYLDGADLRDAHLRGACLSGANLGGADLRDANLCGANLCEEILTKTPIYISNLLWPVTITTQFLTIGCQRHKIDQWNVYDDESISSMHPKALAFWSVWKSPLLAICEAHKAA